MNVLVVQTNQEVGVTAVMEEADTGALVDPSSVQFIVLWPDATRTNPAPTRQSLGVYTTSWILSQRGTYGLQVEATDPDMSTGVNVTADFRYAWSP